MDRRSTRADYPLLLNPKTVEKVWGGDALARMFPGLAASETPIGEVWLIWDGLEITNGPLASQALKDVYADARADLVGSSFPDGPPEAFPLLVKFLDARENLSIQVHPDDAYARSREGEPFGKCEMWYVLAAAEGASIFHGLARDLSAEALSAALTGPTVIDAVARVEVEAGDVVINTPGVIHALGAGVVIFELQQSSDLTYRLYDWDRGVATGIARALHHDKGAEVADRRAILRHKIDPVTLEEGAYRRRLLGACRYFAAELLDLPGGTLLPLAGGQLHVITVLDGSLAVKAREPDSAACELRPGQSCLVPAAVGSSDVVVGDDDCRLIRSFVPDLHRDVAEPLRRRGVSDERIAQLGGDGDRSDIWKVLRGL